MLLSSAYCHCLPVTRTNTRGAGARHHRGGGVNSGVKGLKDGEYVPYLRRGISPYMSQINKSTFTTSGAERLEQKPPCIYCISLPNTDKFIHSFCSLSFDRSNSLFQSEVSTERDIVLPFQFPVSSLSARSASSSLRILPRLIVTFVFYLSFINVF